MNALPELPASVVATLRDRLLERAGLLRREVEQSAHVVPLGDVEVVDRKEAAARQVHSLVADAEVERDRAELSLVEGALQRMERGAYGVCIECGEPIAPARLLAQPAAPRCADCQQRAERAAAQHRGH